MGLFDLFKGKSGGESAERSIARHAERVLDKRALSPDRFASIEYLARLGTREAWASLLPRMNFAVDPSITDQEEKDYIFEAITSSPDEAVEPVKKFLRETSSLNWPLKMLRSMVSSEDLVTELTDFLGSFGTAYEKNHERKVQLLMALEEEKDPRIAPAVLPFLADFNEDVRFHAVRALTAQPDDAARTALIQLLLDDTSARIRVTVVDGLSERGWSLDPEQKDAVAKILPSLPTGPWRISKDLKIVKR